MLSSLMDFHAMFSREDNNKQILWQLEIRRRKNFFFYLATRELAEKIFAM
jgi:hypothetical protein